MSEKILVPELGESITEATLAKWLKNKGDTINADEPVVELETEKVNLEVPSPITGVVSEVNFKNGDTVEVGAVLGTISESQNKKIEKIKKIEKLYLGFSRFDKMQWNAMLYIFVAKFSTSKNIPCI